jgi:hypothetical protein
MMTDPINLLDAVQINLVLVEVLRMEALQMRPTICLLEGKSSVEVGRQELPI